MYHLGNQLEADSRSAPDSMRSPTFCPDEVRAVAPSTGFSARHVGTVGNREHARQTLLDVVPQGTVSCQLGQRAINLFRRGLDQLHHLLADPKEKYQPLQQATRLLVSCS